MTQWRDAVYTALEAPSVPVLDLAAQLGSEHPAWRPLLALVMALQVPLCAWLRVERAGWICWRVARVARWRVRRRWR